MFFFETSAGPGNVTASVPPGMSIESVESELLKKFDGHYDYIKIVRHEIIRLL